MSKSILNNILSVLILISINISLIKSQIELELNKTKTGVIKKSDSYEFYILNLSNISDSKEYILIFEVKEDQNDIKEGEELFSDPDIYVSKKNKNPKNSENAEYYSERYGNDILTIPSNDVKENDTFYIGMYCQYACKFELKAYLSEEIPIEIGKTYFINLPKKSSLIYYIKIEENDFDELSIVSDSFTFDDYKIFVSEKNPSSQNSIKSIPSGISGLTFNIDKRSRHYCIHCIYHILIQSGKEEINIQLIAFFQDSVKDLISGNVILDSVKSRRKRCYSFEIGSNFRNEQVILSISLYSGYGLLNIEGWNYDSELKYDDIKDDKNTYELLGEKSILFSKKDFDEFDKENDSNNEDSDMYFCVYSKTEMSYDIKMYYLNQAPELQNTNFIIPKREVTGFLNNNQITSYLIIEYSIVSASQKSKILINLKSITGYPSIYLYFCFNDDECYFDKESFNRAYKNNELISGSYASYSESVILLEGKDNKCYNNEDCNMYIVVSCYSFFSICQYKITLNIDDNAMLMSPRVTYRSFIPINKVDSYEIIITDDNIESVVIVLNKQNGECSLNVYQNIIENGEKKLRLIDISFNHEYMPNVVRITKKNINRDNLVGNYIVKVNPFTFSSYNIYYYTTYKKVEEEKSEQVDYNSITMSLNEGNMILDFYPNDLKYKIYSYNPISLIKEDIKFILNSQNVKFKFKVFLDLQTFKYDDKAIFEEKIKGYDWVSNTDGELIIKKNDPKYNDEVYYIVVYLEKEITDFLDNSILKYYLGVTKKSVPFILFDGIEQFHTLSNDYINQDFWFTHSNIDKDNLEINFNILNGQIDVYIDVKAINDSIIEKYENNIKSNALNDQFASIINVKNITSSDSIVLDTNYLKKYCKIQYNTDNSLELCPIYIYTKSTYTIFSYILKSTFSIVAIASENTIETLTVGMEKIGSVGNDEYKYYLIEEFRKRKGLILKVTFQKGYGEVYMKILEKKKYNTKDLYPSENDYTLKGNSTYNGKEIIVPEIYFKKNNENMKINMLIAVKGENYFYTEEKNENEYTISFSYPSEVELIKKNMPYFGFLKSGEKKYLSIYFDSSAKNIYISLSNLNGDADLYLNYGKEKLPNFDNFNWKSSKTGHKYIDINLEDQYFKENKIESLEGYYTLLLICYVDTSYTLYVSSLENLVLPIEDNSPMNCECSSQGEKCYFRYDDIYLENNKQINDNQVIFVTHFYYGDGKLYAKISNEREISQSQGNDNFYKLFPNSEHNDANTEDSFQRNYIKLNINKEKYNPDSIILLTFECDEPTEVEINTASLNYDSSYDYLDLGRENIYYVRYNKGINQVNQKELLLSFFNLEEKNIMYTVHSYSGKGNIDIFTNESSFDSFSQKTKYNVEKIVSFIVDSNDEFDAPETYTNYIKYSDKIQNKDIFFKIKPYSDFGFYIKLNYEDKWEKIKIGKNYEFALTSNKMIGYFDIYDEYDSVEFTLSILENMHLIKGTVYIKINDLEKKYGEGKSYTNDYNVPSENNYEYKESTDPYLGTLSITLDNLPKVNKNDNRIIRALFLVKISNIPQEEYDYDYYENEKKKNDDDYDDDYYDQDNIDKDDDDDNYDDDDDYDNYSRKNKDKKNKDKNKNINSKVNKGKYKLRNTQENNLETKISIMVNPLEKQVQRNFAEQMKILYSEKKINYDRKGKILNSFEKIYSLERKDDIDDLMIIEISSCIGNYTFKLSSTYEFDEEDIDYDEFDDYGKKVITINDLNKKHVYLLIEPSEKNDDCIDNKGKKCTVNFSYILYYYTTTLEDYKVSIINENITYYPLNNGIKITIPKISNVDFNGDLREFNKFKFDAFFTSNQSELKKMQSICYLSKLFKENYEQRTFRNFKLDKNNSYLFKNLILNQTYYMNILATNQKTGEIIAFKPIILEKKNVFTLKNIFYFILIVIFSYIGFEILKKLFIFIYNKYTSSQSYNYNNNNGYSRSVSNEGYQRPGMNIEMPSMKLGFSDKIKYTNLSDG